jgi:hypothetical protein
VSKRNWVVSLNTVGRDRDARQQLPNRPQMVGEACHHCWGTGLPPPPVLNDRHAQRSDRARQIVHTIFPDAGGSQHSDLLGKAHGVANQATVHEPSGEVGAFAVGGRLSRSIQGLCIAVDDANSDAEEMPVLIVLLDHLSILPGRLGLFAGWWTPPSAIGRNVSVHVHQRFPMTSPPIGDQRRWTVLMGWATVNLRPQLDRRFRFILPDPASDPQARLRFDQSTPPIVSGIVWVSHVVFFPFRPTYVHSPSICAGPIR